MKAAVYTMSFAMLAGCSSFEEKQAHNEAQIKMIQVQREAQAKEKIAQAEMNQALYEALLGVAKADPSQSGAVAMALAFSSMKGANNESNTPLVALQAPRNEALEWANALAPVAGGVISTLGTAIVSGNVQKRQIEATRDVQINQANQTANAISAVAGLGEAAVANVGDSYSGDYYSLTDSSIDNSTTNTTSQTTTAITDSYNTTDNSNNSDNSDNSDNSVVDNSATDYSTSTTNNDYRTTNEYITYEGTQFTLAGLLEYLQGTGEPYSIAIGDDVYSSEEEGGGGITCIPSFSPGGWDCTES
jgi:hypothetical protein